MNFSARKWRWWLWLGVSLFVGMQTAGADNGPEFGRVVEGSWYGSFEAQGYGSIPVLATLSREGSVTTADGTDFAGGMQSGTHGTWTRSGTNGMEITLLALNFDLAGNFTGFSRTRGNARLTAQRDTLSGSFRTDFFQPGQDPLDPSAVPYRSVPASFQLRRILMH